MTAGNSPIDDTEALVAAARRGDRPALDTLCERFYPEVAAQVHNSLERDFRGARPWLGALFSTGDIVHDVFVGVVAGIDRFRGASRLEFVGFLAKLTRNRLIDMVRFHEAGRRDARRAQHVETGFDLPNGPPPDAVAISAEEVSQMHGLLTGLPERERALLRGRLEDGETFEDLALTLDYPSADSARKAFHVIQARLLMRLRRLDR